MAIEDYPDPFEDALQHGIQRAVQVGSVAVTAAQVYAYQHKTQARIVAERDERARRALHTQMRAEGDAARTAWAPALDPAWLRHADLLQTAHAWGAAMPYADRSVPWYQPMAATAMRKCEERLRGLHPYAMARYDRLRSDGMGPAEAMHEAAPLFARPARAYDAPSTPRPMLVGDGGPTRPAATATAAYSRPRRSARPWEQDFPIPINDVVASAARTIPHAASPARAARGPKRVATPSNGRQG